MDTSANITTEKRVDVYVDGEPVTIDKKFEFSIDSVQCEECGSNLMFKAETDSWGDLNITVEKCDCKND